MLNLTINLRDVMSVYSGRPGCACGCRGKHTYASVTQAAAGKQRGYEVDDDEVNDKVVKLMLGKIMKLALESTIARVVTTPRYVSVELPDRIYIAYFAMPEIFKYRSLKAVAGTRRRALYVGKAAAERRSS